MKLTELSSKELRHLAEIKEQIEKLQQELLRIFGIADQPEPQVEFSTPMPKRRKMSAEAKAKISAAAKKRWKKVWAKGGTHL